MATPRTNEVLYIPWSILTLPLFPTLSTPPGFLLCLLSISRPTQALGNLEKYDENLAHVPKAELRQVFPSVDQPTFEHVYSLFTWESRKRVDPKEFVLTVSMLACPINDVETECVLIFTIFDPDGSGTLDRDEFGQLMKATIMSKVRACVGGVRPRNKTEP